MSHRVLVHGHRGARARFPENTLPGFEYAIAAGADAIEMDLAVTRDNVIVISHNPAVAGAAIHRLTLAELRGRLPTLEEVLRLAPRGAFVFNLEAKSFPRRPRLAPPPEEFARLVLERLRAHAIERRTIFQSFDFRVLRAMRSLAPEIRLGALIAGGARDFPAVSAAAANAEIVAPQYLLVTSKKVAAAHAAGLEVAVWTVNTPAGWRRLIAAGVDAIVTDDPAALIAWLADAQRTP